MIFLNSQKVSYLFILSGFEIPVGLFIFIIKSYETSLITLKTSLTTLKAPLITRKTSFKTHKTSLITRYVSILNRERHVFNTHSSISFQNMIKSYLGLDSNHWVIMKFMRFLYLKLI